MEREAYEASQYKVQNCHKELEAGDFRRLLSLENRRKIKPKEIPSCLIPLLYLPINLKS